MKHKLIQHYDIIGHAHELTFSCFRKQPFLRSRVACEYFIESLDRTRTEKQVKLIAFVLMPEHVHLIVYPEEEGAKISSLLSSIKLPVAMKFSQQLKKHEGAPLGRFWQRGGGYDRNIFTKKALKSSINYIHFNPVRRKLVKEPEDWYWSSAGYYAGLSKFPIKIDEDVLEALV